MTIGLCVCTIPLSDKVRQTQHLRFQLKSDVIFQITTNFVLLQTDSYSLPTNEQRGYREQLKDEQPEQKEEQHETHQLSCLPCHGSKLVRNWGARWSPVCQVGCNFSLRQNKKSMYALKKAAHFLSSEACTELLLTNPALTVSFVCAVVVAPIIRWLLVNHGENKRGARTHGSSIVCICSQVPCSVRNSE